MTVVVVAMAPIKTMDEPVTLNAKTDTPKWFQGLTDALSSQLISVYQEATQSDASYTFRLVWEEPNTDEVIATLNNTRLKFHICLLQRCNALVGIEVGCEVPLPESLSAIDKLELFQIDGELPYLERPGLLVMDMDSTAIEIECIDELAVMAGRGQEVAAVTERAMQGELDFEQSLRQRVSALKGASESIISELCARLPLMPGLEDMVAELQQHGWHIALASGGFTPFVNNLKDKLGLTAAYANQLQIGNGQLTGEVVGTVVDAQYKARVLTKLGEQYGIESTQRLAIGDGANDIPMIEASAFGIAFHAKPKLRAAANAAIDKLDLRVLPYLLRMG